MRIEDEIRQYRFESQAQKAMINIIFTASWMQDQTRSILKPYGLTLQQYNVLRILRGRHPECAYPNEIKAVMLDKNPDLTRLCDRLEANDWITRELDVDNRRKVKINITKKGLKILSDLDPKMRNSTKKFMHIDEKSALVLSTLLDKLRG